MKQFKPLSKLTRRMFFSAFAAVAGACKATFGKPARTVDGKTFQMGCRVGKTATPDHYRDADRYLTICGWEHVPHLDPKDFQELERLMPLHQRSARIRGLPANFDPLDFWACKGE